MANLQVSDYVYLTAKVQDVFYCLFVQKNYQATNFFCLCVASTQNMRANQNFISGRALYENINFNFL